jgi:AraC family ethanolamine operon transcriptional activator
MAEIKKMGTYFTNSIFNNIDQYAEVGRLWDIYFTQLNTGKIEAKISLLSSETFQVFRTSYNKAMLQNGSSPQNLITFGVPQNNLVEFFWRGYKISGNNILIYPLNGEISTESTAGFDVFGLSFLPDYIELVCEQLNYPLLFEKIKNTEVVTISNLYLESLRYFLENIFRNLQNQNQFLSNAKFVETLKYEILKKLLYTINNHLNTSKTHLNRLRDKAFNKAREYIFENQTEPVTVQKLVEETGVSVRTLEYSFLERFGTTPKAVLKSLRLSGANRELISTVEGSIQISDIATRWGFSHMGQFAKDYKLMFGELPSKTLSQT